MPRYIDADELWLQLDKRKSFEQGRNHAYYKGLRDAKKVLEDAPTADVVEIVRCKDCRYECGDACLHALGLAAIESPECYCAYGERKEKTDVE